MMDWLTNLVWIHGQFLGIQWSVWKVLGWLGNVAFSSRFLIQWYATEKRKRVVVPTTFWWLSLIGSLLFLVYSLRQRDSVFIFAYALNWIPYIRNLVIHYRHKQARLTCPGCGKSCTPESRFCSACGTGLVAMEERAG
jgi:lipid-A-disaccharide synthase-like uncharacterized protein